MAYKNNGYARNKVLTITLGSQTYSYDITVSFEDPDNNVRYDDLTDTQFARLSNREYERRIAAFINYVNSLHDGLHDACPNLTLGSLVHDPVSCPIDAEGRV
ncbi:MAG: hypothetical protein IKU05_05485 [Bacteroidales bacterium]|nr:hypothetical protein [Bacteroidales bacterium]MBR6438056.1 hypothetical protein [Bacteroidales bacterium]